MITKQKMKDAATASVTRRPGARAGVRWGGVFEVECRDPQGRLKWRETAPNIVTNAGLNYALDAALSAGTPVTTWYVGLTAATPTVAAGDTMGSHGGWTEFTAYDEAARQTWTDGGVSSQSVSNTASKAEFTVSTNSSSIGGAFLTSDSTKSGSTGTLYAVVAFTGGNKAADDGDTLSVTYTFTAADDGV